MHMCVGSISVQLYIVSVQGNIVCCMQVHLVHSLSNQFVNYMLKYPEFHYLKILHLSLKFVTVNSSLDLRYKHRHY